MTTTTLNTKNFQSAPSVSDAFRQLMSALVAKLPTSTAKAEPLPLSVTDEANRVRDLACSYLQTDPSFADDLFAAADRHELQHLEAAKSRLQ